jgi:hypothetical protein
LSNGQRYTTADFEKLASTDGARATYAGRTTLQRAAIGHTFMGATSERKKRLLEHISKLGFQSLQLTDPDLNGIFYSRANQAQTETPQIKSAIGNNGDFDHANPDIRFSREPQTRSEKIKAELRARKEKLSGARFDNNAHIPMGSLLNVFDRNQIVQLYSKDLPELLTYKAEQEAIVADRNALLYKADTFLDKLRAIPLEARDAIANIAHEATIEGVDPSKDYTDAPVVKDLRKVIAKFADTQKVLGLTEKQLGLLAKANDRVKALEETYARLAKAFNALNPKHQQIFKDLRDEYSASAKRVFDAFEDRIKRLQTSEEAKLGAITELRKQYDQVKQGIYFPLARFGDHVVIGNKMVDGIPAKVVEYYESKSSADQAGIRMQNDGYEVKITKRKEAIADNQSNKVLADVISKLKDLKSDSLDEKTANALRKVIGDSISDMAIGKKARAIANGKASVSSKEVKSMVVDIAKDIKSDEALGAEIKALAEKKVKPLNYAKELDSLLDDVNQAIIQMLPDQSYRRHFTHRKNTKGYSADFIRAYADSSWHAASHISTLRHGDIVTKSIEDMQARIDSATGDTAALQDVVNHLIKREEKLREPTNQTVAFIGQMGFLSALASISNFFVNLTQTPMLTLPFLGARYGYTKASVEMTKALGTQVKAYAKAESLTDLKHALDIRHTISSAESALMTKLIDMGKIDLTQAHDLIDAANKNAPRPNGKWDLAMRVAAFPQHASEVINRQVSALAAIRMELKKSGSPEKAIDAAIQAIDQTHYDYEKSNRAMIMHGNTQRVLFMFKQYAQKTAYLWARTAYLAIGGAQASKQEKSVARKQLAGMLATQFALSGLLGLPIFLEAGAVAAGMTGFKLAGEKGAYVGVALVVIAAMAEGMDDDDPDEFDANVRQWLSEQVGKDAGEVLARGAFRLTGVDIAGRVNADELFVRKPDKTLDGKDARLAWLDSLLGYAIGGQANSVITGMSLMQEGHLYRGFEKIIPVKAVRDLMQANRFANEGVKSLNGNPIVEKLDYSEIMIKAAGFQPQRVAEQYEKNAAVRGSETLLNRRRKDLVTRYVNAEPQDRAEVRAKITEFNRNNPGYMIRPTNLVQSMLSKNKAKRDTIDGIRLPRKHQGTRERGDFANVD